MLDSRTVDLGSMSPRVDRSYPKGLRALRVSMGAAELRWVRWVRCASKRDRAGVDGFVDARID